MPHGVWGHRTIYQLSIIGTYSTVQVVNVHHFENSFAKEALTTSDQVAIVFCSELITEWLTACKTSWLACHDTAYTLTMLRCQVVERPANKSHKLTPAEAAQTTSNVGIEPGGSDTTTSAAVIKWRTPVASKSTRGRSYVGPVPSSMHSAGKLDNVGPQKYNDYAVAMIGAFGSPSAPADPFALTIYSRPFDKGEYSYVIGRNPNREVFYPEDYDGNSTNVIAGVVDTVVRTQRRREVGVGS